MLQRGCGSGAATGAAACGIALVGTVGLAGAASAGGTIGAPMVARGTDGAACTAVEDGTAARRPAAVSTIGDIGAGSRSSPSNTLPRAITSTAP